MPHCLLPCAAIPLVVRHSNASRVSRSIFLNSVSSSQSWRSIPYIVSEMEAMSNSLQYVAGALMTSFITWRLTSAQTCVDLEFTNLRLGHTVKVEENGFVDLTFRLNTSSCRNISNSFRLKVSYDEKGFPVDVCNIILEEKSCKTTYSTRLCRCSHNSENLVVFHKNFTRSDATVYTWMWNDRSENKQEQQKKIVFEVQTVESSSAGHHRPAAVAASAVSHRQTAAATAAEEERTTPAASASTAAAEEGGTTQAAGTNAAAESRTVPASATETNRTSERGMKDAGSTAGPQQHIAGIDYQSVVIQSVFSALGTGVPIAIVICIFIYRRRKDRWSVLIAANMRRHLAAGQQRASRLFGRAFHQGGQKQELRSASSRKSASGLYVELDDYLHPVKESKPGGSTPSEFMDKYVKRV